MFILVFLFLSVIKVNILSTGKSTLLNHLFHTNFKEMDAYRGRFVAFYVTFIYALY